MAISTDKDVYEVGEKFNVSVIVTLADNETLSGISSVISFNPDAFLVDNSPNVVGTLLRPVGGLAMKLPDMEPYPHLIGGAVASLTSSTVLAGSHVTLKVPFEAISPGTYELTLPEGKLGSAKASALMINTEAGAGLVPSEKINRTITIVPTT